jgi:hypothetical protein
MINPQDSAVKNLPRYPVHTQRWLPPLKYINVISPIAAFPTEVALIDF